MWLWLFERQRKGHARGGSVHSARMAEVLLGRLRAPFSSRVRRVFLRYPRSQGATCSPHGDARSWFSQARTTRAACGRGEGLCRVDGLPFADYAIELAFEVLDALLVDGFVAAVEGAVEVADQAPEVRGELSGVAGLRCGPVALLAAVVLWGSLRALVRHQGFPGGGDLPVATVLDRHGDR